MLHLSIVKLGYCFQCFYIGIKYKICCYYHFNVPYSTLGFSLHPHLTPMLSIILKVNSMSIDSPSSRAWSSQIFSVSLWGTSNMGLISMELNNMWHSSSWIMFPLMLWHKLVLCSFYRCIIFHCMSILRTLLFSTFWL